MIKSLRLLLYILPLELAFAADCSPSEKFWTSAGSGFRWTVTGSPFSTYFNNFVTFKESFDQLDPDERGFLIAVGSGGLEIDVKPEGDPFHGLCQKAPVNGCCGLEFLLLNDACFHIVFCLKNFADSAQECQLRNANLAHDLTGQTLDQLTALLNAFRKKDPSGTCGDVCPSNGAQTCIVELDDPNTIRYTTSIHPTTITTSTATVRTYPNTIYNPKRKTGIFSVEEGWRVAFGVPLASFQTPSQLACSRNCFSTDLCTACNFNVLNFTCVLYSSFSQGDLVPDSDWSFVAQRTGC